MNDIWFKVVLGISLGCNIFLVGGLWLQSRRTSSADRHTLSRALHDIENKASDQSAKASQQYRDMKGKMKDTAHEAKENIQGAAHNVKEKAQDTANKAQGAAHGAKERVKDAYHDLADKKR